MEQLLQHKRKVVLHHVEWYLHVPDWHLKKLKFSNKWNGGHFLYTIFWLNDKAGHVNSSIYVFYKKHIQKRTQYIENNIDPPERVWSFQTKSVVKQFF